MNITGEEIYRFSEKIFPIHRSITGPGVRKTLECLAQVVPELSVHEVKSGTKVFDWTVPEEWVPHEAYLADMNGNVLVDMKSNNLHIMAYSDSVDVCLTKKELREKYIYVHPDNDRAIPYVTSYYKRRAGFCVSSEKWDSLPEGQYHLQIDTEFKRDGSLSYGEIVIPGETDREILFSTYICHPQMANNEVSGPAVAIHLAKYIKSLKAHKFTYRFVFVPETIGVITYLSQNLEYLRNHMFAGFNLTCIGDERDYSHICSRYGNNRADIIAENTLDMIAPDHKTYSFLERGSDEREYCAPGIDLPVCTLCRTKFHVFPEYHSSLDDMSVISEKGLYDSFLWLTKIVDEIENNTDEYERIKQVNPYNENVSGNTYKTTVFGEPQLGKRNLYSTLGRNIPYGGNKKLLDVYFYCDGSNDSETISRITGIENREVREIIDILKREKLILECEN